MKKITKFFAIAYLLIMNFCANNIEHFQQNATGIYNVLEANGGVVQPIQQFSIDDTGNMAPDPGLNAPQLEMFFHEGVSSSEAIYQMVQEPRHFVPIKLVTNVIYSNSAQPSKNDVSFDNMQAFGIKISGQ